MSKSSGGHGLPRIRKAVSFRGDDYDPRGGCVAVLLGRSTIELVGGLVLGGTGVGMRLFYRRGRLGANEGWWLVGVPSLVGGGGRE